MINHRRLPVAIAAGFLVAGCSFLVSFNPSGKPCGAGGSCRQGFTCVKDLCVESKDGGSGDAGGSGVQCGTVNCAAGEVCLDGRLQCVSSGCGATACPAGNACAIDNGTPKCSPVTGGGVGARCESDGDCISSGAFCLISSVTADDNGARRYGFCTLNCLTDGDCGTGAACKDLGPDRSVKLCLPLMKSSSQPAYFECVNEDGCKAFPGRTCAVFDAQFIPSATVKLEAPVFFCDEARTQGVAVLWASCDPENNPWAPNGICLGVKPGNTVASVLCSTFGDCGGAECHPAEFAQAKFLPRVISACVTASQRCKSCTGAADCSVDAPRCAPLAAGSMCTNTCLVQSSKGYGCEAGKSCEIVGLGSYCQCN